MGKKGRLTVDQYGGSMPVTMEACQKPPFYYRNMEMMFFIYKTDPDAALAWLPDALELDEPALVTIIFAYYGWSTFGPYHEVMMSISAKLDGEVVSYYPALFTDQEAPLIGGREIWGFAKKLAKIEVKYESEIMMGTVERPSGNRLMTGTMRNVTPVAPEEFSITPSVSMRMIPSASGEGKPALAELIGSSLALKPHIGANGIPHIWTGPGSVHYNTPSEIDPWYKMPVIETVGCYSGMFDAELGPGKVLKTL